MGSAEGDPLADKDEKPQHPVRVPPFELMAFQVTRRLYREIAGKDPGFPKGWFKNYLIM
jgi:formylglycine-generating enzyme required for sulfatase activity